MKACARLRSQFHMIIVQSGSPPIVRKYFASYVGLNAHETNSLVKTSKFVNGFFLFKVCKSKTNATARSASSHTARYFIEGLTHIEVIARVPS
jgi:hypothetical protein